MCHNRGVKDHSQHGESTILYDLFDRIITPASYTAVEFGAGDGWHGSNIRMLMEDGWTGIQWDTDEWITAENINALFAREVPEDVDLVSIDIDGNDYWVWEALDWEPSVVIIEYNSAFPHGRSVTIQYDPDHQWRRDAHYGASMDALVALGEKKGYVLVAEVAHANLIFVHDRHRSQVTPMDPSRVVLPFERFGTPGRVGWVEL